MSYRSQVTPEIKTDATKLADLISWDKKFMSLCLLEKKPEFALKKQEPEEGDACISFEEPNFEYFC